MTAPTPYAPSYNFSGFQSSNPTTPLPAQKLDGELASIATSIASVIASLGSVRRVDGALNNGLVTQASLAPGLAFGVASSVALMSQCLQALAVYDPGQVVAENIAAAPYSAVAVAWRAYEFPQNGAVYNLIASLLTINMTAFYAACLTYPANP